MSLSLYNILTTRNINKIKTSIPFSLKLDEEYQTQLFLGMSPMDCGIVVSEFVLQSRYDVHFRANTLGKGMNPLILPAMC